MTRVSTQLSLWPTWECPGWQAASRALSGPRVPVEEARSVSLRAALITWLEPVMGAGDASQAAVRVFSLAGGTELRRVARVRLSDLRTAMFEAVGRCQDACAGSHWPGARSSDESHRCGCLTSKRMQVALRLLVHVCLREREKEILKFAEAFSIFY